jgi:phenylalanyl-tRNA synthetase beta chain
VPVIEVAKHDLERLTHVRFEELVKLLEHVKCEVEEELGDRVKLEVTHDRPDHFSAEGLARTLKGVADVEVGLPPIKTTWSSLELNAETIEERPYLSMAVVRGVKLDDEAVKQLIQLQEKLHETYGRGRRKIAIGYYDVSKIKPPIFYTRVSQDDEYVPLGFDRPVKIREMYELTEQGRRYSHLINRERPPALVDGARQIMVIIPVLGSECCKITEETRDVLIDVTGTDPRAVHNMLSVLIYALLERSSNKEVEIVRGGATYTHRHMEIEVDTEAVSDLLGVSLSPAEFERLVNKARLGYRGGKVVAPPYRINVLTWVDVAEDVAVMMGYNRLPREAPKVVTGGRRHGTEIFAGEVRRALMSMGFVEVSNYVLTDRAVESLCKAVYVANPISELYNAVRCSIVTQLIATASTMRRREVKLFEVGDVVREGRTLKVAAFLISRDGVTLTDGLSVAKTLCNRLGLNCRVSATEVGWALQNRAARIEGDVSGYVAEANPDLLTIHGHLIPTVVGELVLG